MPKISEVLAGYKAKKGGLPAAAQVIMGYRLSDGTPGDPNCEACKGNGCFRADVMPGHTLFGKLLECECARPLREARISEHLQGQAGLPGGALRLSWADMVTTDAIAPAIAVAQTLLARGWGWGYFFGPYGPGKTTLLKTAVAESIRAERPAVFVMWADLLNHLRQGFANDDYDARIQAWRSVPVLAVDEMGRAKESDWVADARNLIFNPRYESALAGQTVTLFASNTATSELDGWLGDRMRDGRFFIQPVLGDSMRPVME